MFPMMPMMSMPFMGQQPTAEQSAQMQRLALQNQQLQLRQMKQMLEQYAQTIDAALGQLDEQIAKAERGETPVAQVQIQAQAQAQQVQPQWQALQVQPQSLAQRLQYRTDFYRLADPRLMDPRGDPQALLQGGMGDFGRPVF